ncbi:MAG: acylase [Longimicrobiales bacterium]
MTVNQARRSCSLLIAAGLLSWAAGCRPEPRTEILWDTYGVPHIFALTTEDLFQAHGWAQMEAHGNLVLSLYGQARGRAAEYWGEDYLDSDIQVRIRGIPERAQAWYLTQDAEMYEYLQAFTRGMNDYAREHPEKLAEEMRAVLPVEPADVLAHFLRTVHYTFVSGPGVISRSLREGLLEETLGEPVLGSNAWAIGPTRSASGNALLLLNPHLPWSDLYTWFEAHLVGPEFDAYGANLVGLPLLTLGFTDRLGWTHTVNTFDGSDVYELTLRGDGYLFDGEIRTFDTKEDTLLVNTGSGGARTHLLTILHSLHGPVLGKGNGKAYAVRVAGLDESGVFRQYFDMLRARDLDAFQQAVSALQMPMFTTMYADRDGHILHLFNGRVPRRALGDVAYWAGVIPGDVSETLWSEYHTYEELPRVLDPASGWLQNANDPPWTTTFPEAIDPEDYPPYMAPRFMHPRAQRSARMLLEDEAITFEEMVAYKHSTRMELADRLLDDLVRAAHASGRTKAQAGARILEAWDRSANAESRGAVLFMYWAQLISSRTGGNPFATPWDADDPMATPEGIGDPDLGVELLEAAMDTTRARHGAADVAYGDVFRLRRDGLDLPGNGQGDPLGVFRAAWFTPAEYNRQEIFGGDSFVLAVEFGAPLRARVVLGYGNASQPDSPHRTDQLQLFADKAMRPVWRTREEIEAHLRDRVAF